MTQDLIAIRSDAINFINRQIHGLEVRERQALFVNCSMLYDKTFFDLITENDTDRKRFFSDILHYGYSVFISMMYDKAFEDLEGVAIPSLTPERIQFCRSLLYAFKTVGWMDYFLENERVGNFTIKSLLHRTRVKFKKRYHWIEYLEQQNIEHYSAMIASLQSKKYEQLSKRQQSIIDKMKSWVYIYLDKCIGYQSDYDIEDFFHTHALLDAQQEVEWDLFNPESQFQRIPYKTFVESVVDFSGYAIKHIYFCYLLLEKHPDLLFENLMYNCSPSEGLISLITENREISEAEARIILSNISLSSSNVNLYALKQLTPPVFIRVSKGQYLQSTAGSLWQRFSFMLESIHTNYSKDWDRNVQEREYIFKQQLYSLFPGFICQKNNIEIQKDGKILTDIDATIIDKATGEVGLFQLKWQDPSKHSAKSLRSKAQNYDRETSNWIARVQWWIQCSPTYELAAKLGIKEKFVDKNKFYIFIIGRQHGNYSRDSSPNNDCAWVQWYQLLAYIRYLGAEGLKLSSLHQLIKNHSLYKEKIVEKKIKYRIGKYTILFGG